MYLIVAPVGKGLLNGVPVLLMLFNLVTEPWYQSLVEPFDLPVSLRVVLRSCDQPCA